MSTIAIRRADDADWPDIWPIFQTVIARGDAYMFDESTTMEAARLLWMGPAFRTYVAESEGRVVGSYYIKPNHPGHGAHVANGGYMTAEGFEGRGIGRLMCEHSLREARSAGFRAMQFNAVISTNVRAVKLWQDCGFDIVGTLPQAFRHPAEGYVDVYVMHRFL